MSSLPSETDLDKNINQLLKCLHSFDHSDRPAGCDFITLNQFIRKAAGAVRQLQFELKRPLLKQLIAMVLNQEWDDAAKALKKNFPRRSTNDGTEKEAVLAGVMSIIVYDEEEDGIAKAVELVGKLEVGLQPMACMALHKLMEKTKRTQSAQSVAVLLNVIKNWPEGVQQDFDPKAREALEEWGSRIIIETSDKILGKWDVKWESTAACKTMMPLLVARINTISGPNFNEDIFFSLLEFSKKQINSRHGYATAYVIHSLLNVLEETSQLDSKLAMFLWAHSAYVKENSFGRRHRDQDTEELIKSAWEKLSKLESKLILHFLPFVENNKLEIKLLLRADSHLESIGPNFVHWYYNGNTERTKNLLAFARGCETTWKNEILRQLQVEVVRTQQTYTFESFILYNMIKHCPEICNYAEQVYYSSAPDCAVLLLAQDESAEKASGDGAYHIRLVNKLFPFPLGTHEEKAVCSRMSPNQRFNAIVDPKSALIKFNVQPGNTSLQIDQDDKTVNFAKDGTEWKVVAVDQQHVKIFTEAGKFLTAGERCPSSDKTTRYVCVMPESGMDDQVWKLEKLKVPRTRTY